MNYKNTFGFGIAIWVIMFVLVSVFVAFSFYENIWGKAFAVLISGVLGYFFGRWAHVPNWAVWFYVAVSWVIVGLILDYLITLRFEPAIFSFKSLWFGYLFLVLGSILGGKGRGKRF